MAKVLVIGKFYYPFRGGIEENTRYVAEYASRYHDVTVLAYNHVPGNVTEFVNGVRVIRKNVNLTFKGQPVSLDLLSGIDFDQYDLIHFHSPNPFASVMLLVFRLMNTGKPVVVTHHMDIFGRKILRALTLPFIRSLVKQAQTTIVTSKKNLAVSKDLPKTARYSVIPLAVSPNDFQIDEAIASEGAELRRELAGKAPLIGFVGRHARYKGIDVLLKAVKLLPEVHAVIAGDGPYRQDAEKQAVELGIDGRVHFVGNIDQRTKLKMFSAIDVFAFPSTEITEAFGVSQMEAMLCGVPTVASNLPTGVTDVAIDGETALLAIPGDSVDLASKIERLLLDKPLAEKLARNARAHVLSNMSYEVVGRRTLEVFESALKSPSLFSQSVTADVRS